MAKQGLKSYSVNEYEMPARNVCNIHKNWPLKKLSTMDFPISLNFVFIFFFLSFISERVKIDRDPNCVSLLSPKMPKSIYQEINYFDDAAMTKSSQRKCIYKRN